MEVQVSKSIVNHAINKRLSEVQNKAYSLVGLVENGVEHTESFVEAAESFRDIPIDESVNVKVMCEDTCIMLDETLKLIKSFEYATKQLKEFRLSLRSVE